MPNYYIDPATDNLIIYDPEENEIRVLQTIEETEYEEDGEVEEPEKPKKPKKEKLEKKKPGEKRGRARNLTHEMIDKIRSMYKDHPAGYIADELEISPSVIYKYTKGIKKSEKPKPPKKEKKGFKPFLTEQGEEPAQGDKEEKDDLLT